MRYLRLFEDVNYYVEISPGEFNDVSWNTINCVDFSKSLIKKIVMNLTNSIKGVSIKEEDINVELGYGMKCVYSILVHIDNEYSFSINKISVPHHPTRATLRNRKISINIFHSEDEWYYVCCNMGNQIGIYYKCDQFDGLISLLKNIL